MRMLAAAAGPVIGLGFSPSADALAAAVDYHGVYLWNLAAASPVPVTLDSVGPNAGRPAFSPDGRSVAWRTFRGRRVYDRDARRAADTRFDRPGNINHLAQTPAWDRLFTLYSFPKPALLAWRAAADGWERAWETRTEHQAVHELAVCPTGRRVALLTRETHGVERWWVNPIRVELRSAATGAVEGYGQYPYNFSSPPVFSPDGRQLVAVRAMTLLVWRVPELGPPRLIRNDTRKHFTAVAYHPDGRHLFATSNDTTVHVFDTTSWERVGRFTWHLGRLQSVAVSPDGSLAAAGGDAGQVVVWDVDV